MPNTCVANGLRSRKGCNLCTRTMLSGQADPPSAQFPVLSQTQRIGLDPRAGKVKKTENISCACKGTRQTYFHILNVTLADLCVSGLRVKLTDFIRICSLMAFCMRALGLLRCKCLFCYEARSSDNIWSLMLFGHICNGKNKTFQVSGFRSFISI